ncbi:hypothetical protein ACO0RG_000658 [Hanseniaspora osmophila]
MPKTNEVAVHRARFVDFQQGNITALAFSHVSNSEKLTPSDLRLAVGRSDGQIEIWNPRNSWFQELTIPNGFDRSIEGLVWCNEPNEPLRLFSIGGSTVVTEWDISTGLPLKNYDCNAGVIWSIAINRSQTRLAVGCDNGSVVLIDISGGKGYLEHVALLQKQESRVLTITWKNDQFVIGGCADGRIRIWEADSSSTQTGSKQFYGRLLHTMKVDKSKKESTLVWSVLYLPLKDQIVTGDSTGAVKFWDFKYATLVQSFKTHSADVLCLTTNASNNSVFSAGVDRKIYQMKLETKSKTVSWAVTANRLFHNNDIRSIASFESKGADLLVSGGVEKKIVVCNLSNFENCIYNKLSIVSSNVPVLINEDQRLVCSWKEQVVKIWYVGQSDAAAGATAAAAASEDKNYKLVCKLSLKDQENITHCALSPDGQVLVVGRLTTTKVFFLQPQNDKLKVTKLENKFLLVTGSKLVDFVDNSKICLITPEDEIFTVDLEEDHQESFELPELSNAYITSTTAAMKLPHLEKLHLLRASSNGAVVARPCGTVEYIDFETKQVTTLIKLMSFITAISFLPNRKTIILTTAENKIFEFDTPTTENAEAASFQTRWSFQNSEYLPRSFVTQKDKCLGIFEDQNNRVWFWGVSWLCNFNLNYDIPNNRKKPKKRSHDGLTINDASSFLQNDQEEKEEDEIMELEKSVHMLSKVRDDRGEVKLSADGESTFFITEKFKPILCAGKLSENEIGIVEVPILKSTASFHLPKYDT